MTRRQYVAQVRPIDGGWNILVEGVGAIEECTAASAPDAARALVARHLGKPVDELLDNEVVVEWQLQSLSTLLVVEQARQQDPDGDDLEERLSDLTGEPFHVCGEAIKDAIAQGYLEYHDITEIPLDARPTEAGLTLLNEQEGP